MSALTTLALRLVLAFTAIGLSAGTLAGGRPDLVLAQLEEPHRQFVPNELLVEFAPGSTDTIRRQALAGVSGRVASLVRRDVYQVSLPMSTDLSVVIRTLSNTPGIVLAEPNWLYSFDAVSNDPAYTSNQLWGMQGDKSPLFKNRYGSQAAEAWKKDHFECVGIGVAVIDSGAMLSHPDLRDNFWVNPEEIPGNGIDDDHNGYIDDTQGWDFLNDDNTVYDGPLDGHGTHVAGTIGARGGNSEGVAGICWTISLVSLKVADGDHPPTAARAIRAVDYVSGLQCSGQLNVVAMNASWGLGGYSATLKNAIEDAGGCDVLFVAAAGNSGVDIDVTPGYPASYDSPNIISVAAIDSAGQLWPMSNYGKVGVDLGAPGVDVFSTVPGGYDFGSGTSMAAPHVTGAIALYASTHPGLSFRAMKKAILAKTLATTSLNSKTSTGGRLNLSRF